MDPDLFKAFAGAFHSEVNRGLIQQRAGRAAAEQELQRTVLRIRRTLDLLLDRDDPPRSLLDDLRTLEARKDEISAKIAAMSEPGPFLHPNLAEVYRSKVAELGRLLEDPATRQEAFELIRSLIETIGLVPEDRQLKVELRGELAAILELCAANAKKPGSMSPASAVRQFKMVAGT